MANFIIFNKPFRVLSQFTDRSTNKAPRRTLANYIEAKGYKVAGRLDYDSEGLLFLTPDGRLLHQITEPLNRIWKTYLVQVEGLISAEAIQRLQAGISLKDGPTLPAKVSVLPRPNIWQREPPIRYRKSVPDTWINISIHEGRNRQIRRMTAAVGFPTLRLIRMAIGKYGLKDLQPGEFYFDSTS